MFDLNTITFVCGVIMCILGICTFVTGLFSRAKQDGILTNKVDCALQGITEIKEEIKSDKQWRENVVIQLASHEEKIITLYHKVEEITKKV